MPIPTVPFNKKRQSLSLSEEDRQIRMLAMDAVMSNSLKERIAKEIESGKIKGPGVPDGTGPGRDSEECPFNSEVEVAPIGRGLGRGPGLGQGRSIPGVPGTGPRGGTPACPLSQDLEEVDVDDIDEDSEDIQELNEISLLDDSLDVDSLSETDLDKAIDILSGILLREGIDTIEISVKKDEGGDITDKSAGIAPKKAAFIDNDKQAVIEAVQPKVLKWINHVADRVEALSGAGAYITPYEDSYTEAGNEFSWGFVGKYIWLKLSVIVAGDYGVVILEGPELNTKKIVTLRYVPDVIDDIISANPPEEIASLLLNNTEDIYDNDNADDWDELLI